MARAKVQFGLFDDLFQYARWGCGDRVMVVFPGGPGNSIPKGMAFGMMNKGLAPFVRDYTIYMVTRRRGQPEGYTTRDMSDDYARVIADHLGGRVDAVVGISFGGMIAQHFAADHHERARRIVVAAAAYKVGEAGKEIDNRFAEYLSRGHNRRAAATIVEALAPPGAGRLLLQALGWLVGGGMYRKEHASFRQDVLVEARAELDHDAGERLERIQVPVLIVGGTADLYFPRDYLEATAARIPKGVLRLYEGKGHMGTLTDRRFSSDLREFLS